MCSTFVTALSIVWMPSIEATSHMPKEGIPLTHSLLIRLCLYDIQQARSECIEEISLVTMLNNPSAGIMSLVCYA